VSKKALTAVLLAVMVPVICYLLVKKASDHAIDMPHRFFYDSVTVTMRDGKAISDTIWH